MRAGDLVLSRDDLDDGSAGPTPRLVEEVFTREGGLWELVVAGREIRTTPEHPFFVRGRGWTPAGELEPGDLLGTATGGQIAAVDQDGKTVWMFADTSGVVRSVGALDGADWEVLHRHYDDYGQRTNFLITDEAATTLGLTNKPPNGLPHLGDEESYLIDAPEFFQGARWDADARLFDFGGRWYDPYSGRYATDAGGTNGYRFMENDPVRERGQVQDSGLTREDYTQIYGDGIVGGFNYLVGESVRSAVGSDRLARASDTQLLVGTTLAVGGAVLGGYGAAYAIAAGANAAGLGVGAYVASQAGISAVETGIELGLTSAFGGEFTPGGAATSFAKNLFVNSVTGGIGGGASLAGRVAAYAGRQAIEIGADTAIDVGNGGSLGGSLAFNAIASIGGEALVRGAIGSVSGSRTFQLPTTSHRWELASRLSWLS